MLLYKMSDESYGCKVTNYFFIVQTFLDLLL